MAAHRPAVIILSAFLILAFIYSLVTPIFEGYDEDSHFAFAQHVATGQGLPRQPASQYPHLAKHEANQPPLYYLIAASLTWWIPTGDLPHFLRQNPQAVYFPLPYHDNQNGLLHDDAERFPYSGTVLAVHLARLLSILFGAGAIVCTYALARTLFPADPRLALGALTVHAFTPSFLFGSALVNNDSLVTFTSGLSLLMLAHVWRAPFAYRRFALLGLVLGAAALSKLSALWTWPFAALIIALLAWRSRDYRRYVQAGVLTFAIAGMLAGWWYVRNWVYYGDVTGLNMLLDIIGRREKGFGLLDFLPETEGIRWSYWALFGWFNLPVAGWLYRVYDAALLVALAGLIIFVVQAMRARRWAILAAAGFVAAWLALVVIALVNLNLVTIVAQGRLLFPAATAISILFVLGWQQLLPVKPLWTRWLLRAGAAALVAIAVVVPFTVVAPAYAVPEPLTAQQAAAQIAERADVFYADKVLLLGVALDRPVVRPGELFWVRACWQGQRPMDEDYFVTVQLLVNGDLIAAQKDTYHGLGIFPTTRWPAGITFCESYPLPVADTTPASAAPTIFIGLYGADGTRLSMRFLTETVSGQTVRLAGPRIETRDQPLAYEWGHRIALVDYQLDKTELSPGDEINLTLRWQILQEWKSNLAATVQIADAQGKVGQSDAQLNMAQPAGTLLTDTRTIRIAPEAKAGVYDIRLGIYEPATVQNLLLYHEQRVMLGGGLLPLWRLRIQAGRK